MDYAALKVAVYAELQDVEDDLVIQIPNFFKAVEDVIFGSIEGNQFFKQVTTTSLVDGTRTYSVDDADASLGVIDLLSVRISETAGGAQAQVALGPIRYLDLMEYDFLLEAYPGTALAQTTGIPKYYAIADRVLTASFTPDIRIRLGPVPDADYLMTVTYLGKPPSDSITASESKQTWLSETYPDALISGVLSRAGAFQRMDTPASQKWDRQFMDWLAIIKNTIVVRERSDAQNPAPPIAAGGAQ